jgi:hypothetical protein
VRPTAALLRYRASAEGLEGLSGQRDSVLPPIVASCAVISEPAFAQWLAEAAPAAGLAPLPIKPALKSFPHSGAAHKIIVIYLTLPWRRDGFGAWVKPMFDLQRRFV